MSVGRYLEMPESRELYSSPVLHTKRDKAQYVLFGHGGETIVGRKNFGREKEGEKISVKGGLGTKDNKVQTQLNKMIW